MTPELETQAEIRKTGHQWIDLVVAGCALVVSVTSLFVAVHHGHTMERMAEANARLVAANSWPLLQEYSSNVGMNNVEPVESVNVINAGVGPAKVETLEVFWKGQPIHSARELVQTCCMGQQDPALIGQLRQSSLRGMVLRAGEVRRLLELPETDATRTVVGRLSQSLKDLTMRACYCSVFDECWVTNLHELHPKAVKVCPVPASQLMD
jgi:hypothetical protein